MKITCDRCKKEFEGMNWMHCFECDCPLWLRMRDDENWDMNRPMEKKEQD